MVSRAVALCGTELVDPPMRTLRAGPLSAEFDNGALRYIRFGGVEVLRAIAFLVRDENWGTFTPVLDNLRIEESGTCFTVAYRGTCADATRELVYGATITGRSNGSLDFEVVADPRTDVLTNRTGFIVLHPVDGVAGQPVPHPARRRQRGDLALPRRRSIRPAPSATSARSRTRSRPAPGRPAPWRATPTRWRTSATGPTPPTRPTSAR